MAAQNLVSAEITPEVKTALLQSLADLKAKLNFVIAIEPSEKNEYVKVGNTYLPFIEKALGVVDVHPEIMSSLFDIREFKRDCQLTKDLVPILNEVHEIAEAIENTIFAANSDAMAESLEVYSAVGVNNDKVPGMNTIYAEMQAFFRKPRKKLAPSDGSGQTGQ